MAPRRAALAAAALLAVAAAAAALEVVVLDTASFEHQTQAATGMTTGHWCVLFTDSSAGDDATEGLEAAWDEMAADVEEMEYPSLFAKVDVHESPEVGRRFGLRELPAAIFFRDRLMHRLPLPLPGAKDAAAHFVLDFLAGGWQEVDGDSVPPEAAGRRGGSSSGKAKAAAGGGGGGAATVAALQARAAELLAAAAGSDAGAAAIVVGRRLAAALGETGAVLRVTGMAAGVVAVIIIAMASFLGVGMLRQSPAEGPANGSKHGGDSEPAASPARAAPRSPAPAANGGGDGAAEATPSRRVTRRSARA